MKKNLETEFWKRVQKKEKCWEWTGSINDNGYGALTCNGDQFLAHRLSHILKHGPVPEGLQVFHVCGLRKCVNPDHLKLEDPKQVNLGKYWKNRKRVHPPRGEV